MLCYTVQQRIPTGMWECICNHLENSNYMYHKGISYSDGMDLNIKKKKGKRDITYLGISGHIGEHHKENVFQKAPL